MKKTIPMALAILFFLAISCEKESKELIKSEVSVDASSEVGNRGGVTCTNPENFFEIQLQWFAFIAAKTAANNSDARIELVSHLSNTPSNVISAEDLVGPNATLPVFSAKFYQTLLPYMCICDPGSGTYYPPPPPVQGGFPEGTPNWEIAEVFYANMLEDNCVEFFFPVAVDFSSGFTVTSSSHPLTAANCNEGFIWQNVLGGMAASPIVLDQAYVNAHDNVFIARPLRDPLIANCHYTEYPGIDFTDFMK